mgnify:CR=1 FL=1
MLPSLGDHTAPRGAQPPGFLHPALRVPTHDTNTRELLRGAVLTTPSQRFITERNKPLDSSSLLLNLLCGRLSRLPPRHVQARRASALTYISGEGKNPDRTSTTLRIVWFGRAISTLPRQCLYGPLEGILPLSATWERA